MKTILRKGTGTGNIINNQNRKGKETMKQENEILNIYAKKMRIFKNLGNGQGVEKSKNLMQDVLNESCIKILQISKQEKIENIEHLFNKIIRNTTIDKLRSFNTESQIIEFEHSFDTFDSDVMQYNEEYQNYKELLTHVFKKLNRMEKTLFNLYHVKTNSMQFIADILHTDKMDISRKIRKLNKKLYRMKLKDLFFVPFIAPCLTQDKKLPSYGMSQPNDKDHIKIINQSKETMFIYKSDNIDIKQYETPVKQSDKNEFFGNYQDVNMNHTINKPYFDNIEYIGYDTGHGIDYKRLIFKDDYKGDSINTYGCMVRYNTVNNQSLVGLINKPYKLIDRVNEMIRINQLKIDTITKQDVKYQSIIRNVYQSILTCQLFGFIQYSQVN